MYIIQTNTSFNNNIIGDFQSIMYKITKQNWKEFKEYILSDDDFTQKIIKGTMMGCTKPMKSKVREIIINDDIHLEIIIEGLNTMNVKYYMVTDKNFSNLE